jgi:hypothetical protein
MIIQKLLKLIETLSSNLDIHQLTRIPIVSGFKASKLKMTNSTYSCVKYFQIFGFHFVDLKKSKFATKKERFLAYFGYTQYFIKWIIFTGFLIHYLLTSQTLIFRENYLKVCLIWWFYPYGIMTLVLNFWYREDDWKFWKILDQTDELITKLLKVPINVKKFNKVRNCLLVGFTGFVVIAIVRIFHGSPLIRHQPDYYTAAIKFIAISTQLSLVKFIFYVYIISNRLQLLLTCYISTEEKILVYQRILMNLWMMSMKIEKIFGFQMILYGMSIIVSVISSGHFLFIHIFANNLHFEPIFYVLIPFVTNFLISCLCQNCMSQVSQ